MPQAEVFSFFCEARNLDRITPPWLHFKVLGQSPHEINAGTSIHYRLVWHGMPLTWTSCIEEWVPPRRFVDLQLRGPYRLWHHIHSLEPLHDGTLISARVRFSGPFGALGDLCAGWLVGRDVERIFNYRARAIAAIFGAQPVSSESGRHACG